MNAEELHLKAHQRALIEIGFNNWKSLRNKTSSHQFTCDCSDCLSKKRIANSIRIPFEGEFTLQDLVRINKID